jgi:ABC-type phosphate/phosphonate transport system ATPase subunit
MTAFHEADIFTARFWERLASSEDANSTGDDFLRHTLFLLFLQWIKDEIETNANIISEIWKLNDSTGEFARSDELLRRMSIMDWLGDTHSGDYQEKVRRAYLATLKVLYVSPAPPAKISQIRKWSPQVHRFISEHIKGCDNPTISLLFDYGHDVVTRNQIDVAREKYCANLATSLCVGKINSIADLYSPTARFARILAARSRGPITCLIGSAFAEEYSRMRLKMQATSVEQTEAQTSAANNSATSSLDFVLLNPGFKKSAKGKQVLPFSSSAAVMSTSDLIEPFFSLIRFGLALIIMPQSECKGSNSFRLRRRLIEEDRLLAVIDLPKAASDENTRFSAWLMSGNSLQYRDEKKSVLFIDAESLARLTPQDDPATSTDFIAALVADLYEDIETQFKIIDELESRDPLLSSIFAREFSPGIHEAPGLSKSVAIDEIVQQKYALVAKQYVSDRVSSLWERGISMEPLMAVISSDMRGKRMYLIGDNGEGKSLTLKGIAEDSVRSGRMTVTVAFGSTDRFPTRLAGLSSKTYKYLGARQVNRTVNSERSAVSLGALMLRVHADDKRRNLLDELFAQIGFRAQQFLIPRDLKSAASHSSLISGVVNFSSTDADDIALMQKIQSDASMALRYKLGLQRKSRENILSFDELSSGEQQIITLIVKLLSEANQGTLFLIDEPEISLHVIWQRAVPTLLARIAETFNTDIIVATHSPVLISSATGNNDFCFTLRDRAIMRLEPVDRRSVETVLFEGFRTYTVQNREVHERCAALVAEAIALTNSGSGSEVNSLLSKLDDMDHIVQKQEKFAEYADVEFDRGLIQRAKAAIIELNNLASTNYQNRA